MNPKGGSSLILGHDQAPTVAGGIVDGNDSLTRILGDGTSVWSWWLASLMDRLPEEDAGEALLHHREQLHWWTRSVQHADNLQGPRAVCRDLVRFIRLLGGLSKHCAMDAF